MVLSKNRYWQMFWHTNRKILFFFISENDIFPHKFTLKTVRVTFLGICG